MHSPKDLSFQILENDAAQKWLGCMLAEMVGYGPEQLNRS